jgi:glutamate-1-semialdehyde aminotransferase
MRKALFLGLVNEGVLLQIVSAGALSTVTTDQDNDAIVNAVRSVVERIK